MVCLIPFHLTGRVQHEANLEKCKKKKELNSVESKLHKYAHIMYALTHVHIGTHTDLPKPAALQYGESGSEQF